MKVSVSLLPTKRLPFDYMNMVYRVKNKEMETREGFLSFSLVDACLSSQLSGYEPVTAWAP